MNEKPKLENTFDGGVAGDYDAQRMPKNALTYSLNGRVIFNKKGTLSWNNGNGNKLAIALGFEYGNFVPGTTRPYKIIGVGEIQGYLVLYSTQNTVNNVGSNQFYSEIGLLSEPQKGNYVYQTVFNDQWDPNGDLLHLNTRYQCKVQAILENKNTIRSYWCDDFNEDRIFNVVAGLYPLPINNVTYFAQPYLPYTIQPTPGNNGVQNAVAGAKYPYWYSVHGMSELCDVQFGLVKYRRNIPGAKTSGVRQYFYRLVHKSGYATPWSTGTGMIFCTVPDINATDWTQYSMSASGLVTTKGHELEINYIDQRFTTIEVAWAYYITDGPPTSAGIFFQGPITGPTMIVSDINENVVVPLPDPTVLAQRYVDVIHSKTKLINEQYQHKGNVVLRGILEIDTSLVTIQPMLRLMSSDVTKDVNTTPLTNGINTVTPIADDSVNVQLFQQGPGGPQPNQPWNETYILGDTSPTGQFDYINYKGTQWDCLFKGEFRGQKVPFAIVLFSRKGQPFFAQHIGDFTMPEQYAEQWENMTLNPDGSIRIRTGTNNAGIPELAVNGYTLTTFRPPGSSLPVTNKRTLGDCGGLGVKILGKMISGIDLTNVLYDQYGKLQISGFSIVRADRVPNLIAQGLVLNCSYNIQGDTPILGDGQFISPLHSTGNAYFNRVSTSPIEYQNTNIDHGGIDSDSTIIGNYFTLELPDNLINPAIISGPLTGNNNGLPTGYNLKLVGNVQASFVGQETIADPCSGNPVTGLEPTQLAYTGFYTKNYITVMDGLTGSDQAAGTSAVGLFSATNRLGDFGSQINIERLWTPDNVLVNQTTAIDNSLFTNISFLNDFFFNIACRGSGAQKGQWHAIGTNTQVVMKTPTVTPTFLNASLQAALIVIPKADSVALGPNPVTYYLANIVSGEPSVLNQSIISSRIYKNIGHFVPINADILAAVKTVVGGQAKYIFNNCEVWGGDCYVDFFGYGRLIPLYDNGAKPKQTPEMFDYGCGLIFPCETVYNHTMRPGNTFPAVALRPGVDENPVSTGTTPVFNSGLFVNALDSTDARTEDFNLNVVLGATDKLDTYNVKNIYYIDEPDQPLLEMVSNIKYNGETYDQFRLFLVNNTQNADSQYGFVTDLQAIGHNIYVLQEKGFGRIRFNDRTLQQTTNDNLTVGTGQGYQGHEYLGGSQFGCQHEWSVVNNKEGFFWTNAYMGKQNRFGGNGLECLSDKYGQHSYFEANGENYWTIPAGILADTNENIYDNPCDVGGIASGYDYSNGSVLTTFTQWKTTVNQDRIVLNGIPTTMEFGQTGNHYEGNWSFFPGIYLTRFKQNFLTYDNLHPEKVYVHNEGAKGSFYEIIYDSKLEFIVNPGEAAIYDNMELDIDPTAYAGMKNVIGLTVNGSQQVNFNDITDSRPVYRNSALLFPIMQNNQNVRLRGDYLDVTYTVNNVPNVDVLVTKNTTYLRKDFR